MTHPPNV